MAAVNQPEECQQMIEQHDEAEVEHPRQVFPKQPTESYTKAIYERTKSNPQASYHEYEGNGMIYQRFYNDVCKSGLNLTITENAFNHKVDESMEQHNMSHHQALIEVALDLLTDEVESQERALFSVVSARMAEPLILLLLTRLLVRAVDPTVTDKEHRSPLHFSVERNHPNVTEKLLEYGAVATQVDFEGKSPLQTALTEEKDQLSALMIRYMDNPSVRKLFTKDEGRAQPQFLLHNLIQHKTMKETVLAVLDSTIDKDIWNAAGKAKVHYSLLEADEYGNYPDDIEFSSKNKTCFQLIAGCGDHDFVCHPAVRLLLDRKWASYARCAYIISGVNHLFKLLVLTFLVVITVNREHPDHYDMELDKLRASLEVIVLASAVGRVVIEISEMIRFRCDYFLDQYNYLDIGSACLFLILIPLRFTELSAHWAVYSIAFLFTALRTLKYAAIFRRLRTYLRIMFVLVTQEFKEFGIMFLILALAFAGSFSLALRVCEDKLPDNKQLNFWSIYWTGLRMIIEDSKILEYYDDEGHIFGLLATIIFVLYMVIIMVMLLNILIAHLSDVYNRISKGAVIEVELHQAWIVARVERNIVFNFAYRIALKGANILRRHYVDHGMVKPHILEEYARVKENSSPKEVQKKISHVIEQLDELDINSRTMNERLKAQEALLQQILARLNQSE